MRVWSLHQEDLLEEEMATCSSVAWKIPCTEEPGGLQSMGSQRVRNHWTHTHTHTHTRCLHLYCICTSNLHWGHLSTLRNFPLNQFSSVMSNSLQPYGLQHSRPPCPSPTPGVCSNSCPLSWWCHPTISSSVVPFSSCLQFFPGSGSFPVSQLFASGSQNIGISTSASVLPMNIQDWFTLGLTSWISLPSKGFSRVFSNTTVQNHQLFGTQLYSPDISTEYLLYWFIFQFLAWNMFSLF